MRPAALAAALMPSSLLTNQCFRLCSQTIYRSKMKLKIFTVDAFAAKPFEGNPAAVVPLHESLPEELMQKIAFEMNLSETAYVTPATPVTPVTPPPDSSPFKDGNRFSLRWFTPTKEVSLCGHATLATAHTLFHSLGNKSSTLEFETLSGILFAKNQDGEIMLDLPSNPPKLLTESEREKYAELITVVVGKTPVKEILLATNGKMLIRIEDSCTRADLENLTPNPEKMLELHDGSEVRGVIASVKGNEGYHFLSRYFAPWVGIPEDPVTGSAHTVLAPYWAKEFNQKELKCRQCSRRGGDLHLKIRDDNRIDILGKGVTVIQGEIEV